MPDRTCANGIFYVMRTGCQWKALDATGICSGSTAHLGFHEWVAAGVFLDLWRVGLERYDELKGLDWSWLSLNWVMTKSPLGGGKPPQPHGSGEEGRQTQSVDRNPGYSSGLRGGWGQLLRHEAGTSDGGTVSRPSARRPAQSVPRVCDWTRATILLRGVAP